MSFDLEEKNTAVQMTFSSSAEVLLSHSAALLGDRRGFLFLFSPLKRSKECSTGDKQRMKMGPGDKAAFPISRSWTEGDPGSCCLANTTALSPDSPAIHYQDVRCVHQTTSGALWCHISAT